MELPSVIAIIKILKIQLSLKGETPIQIPINIAMSEYIYLFYLNRVNVIFISFKIKCNKKLISLHYRTTAGEIIYAPAFIQISR